MLGKEKGEMESGAYCSKSDSFIVVTEKVEVKVTFNAAGRNCEDGWRRSSDWRHRPRHLQFTLSGESLASSFSSYTAMMESPAP